MKRLLRRSGVFAVAPIWAFVWALPGGALEALSNIGIDFPITSLFDIWPMVLAIPGAIASVVFCAGLWSPDGERRLDEWSLVRLGSWGGVTGLLPGILAFFSGVAHPEYLDVWPRATIIIGLTTLLGIAAAVVTAVAFRYAARAEAPVPAAARG